MTWHSLDDSSNRGSKGVEITQQRLKHHDKALQNVICMAETKLGKTYLPRRTENQSLIKTFQFCTTYEKYVIWSKSPTPFCICYVKYLSVFLVGLAPEHDCHPWHLMADGSQAGSKRPKSQGWARLSKVLKIAAKSKGQVRKSKLVVVFSFL